ncbi:MAG: alpha-glucan family phosphorylase [Microscillaceae bacterium]|nr:alpha-glucan family phosphorylase [Microscillaceae bacterium]
MSSNNTWQLPYKVDAKYKTKVAYFCMEYAIDQSLKIYSGGLGFLAGSHLRSAYDLKQNFVAVGMLWKYGYYDQVRNDDRTMRAQFIEKSYNFLQDTNITVTVTINTNQRVYVKAYYLPPDLFGTAPLYLLTTDIPENDHLARTITHRLYDDNIATRVAQSIVLGIGGGKVIEALGGADMYHINEGHALPLASYLFQKYNNDLEEVRKHFVFTTHTPEKAGNEEHDAFFLNQMGFFNRVLTPREIQDVTDHRHNLNYTVTALRMSKLANGVSKLHGEVSRLMWKEYDNICPIISITNAQNGKYWQDDDLYKHLEKGNDKALIERKKELKSWLFRVVADQTGKIFDPNVLTIVWARRFAGYKRADLLLNDIARFKKLVNQTDKKVQIIWAGKPYPTDIQSVSVFNHLVSYTQENANCAVLTGYELRLSRLLKGGADIWLNTPRRPREASGTSGMTAAMNGGVNFSTFDGWVCEFVEHGKNGFLIPIVDETLPVEEQDERDCDEMYKVLENEIIPTYYDKPEEWLKIVKASLQGVKPQFESGRMAEEYYRLLYNA